MKKLIKLLTIYMSEELLLIMSIFLLEKEASLSDLTEKLINN